MLTGLLIFLLVVIVLLAIPLALEFRVTWPDDEKNEIILVWALGLVRTRLQTGHSGKTSKAETASPDSGKRNTGKSTNVLAAVRQRPFRRRIYRFVGDLWRSIARENLCIRARIGLGDPADTGKLWALIGPASGSLAGRKGITVVVIPDFADATFEINGQGRLQVVPLRILAIVTGLLFSPAIWRGFRAMRTS